MLPTTRLASIALTLLVLPLGSLPAMAAPDDIFSFGDLFTGETGHLWSSPKNFVPLGSATVFVAYDIPHGEELWITDGTSQGTILLKDIYPGRASSSIEELTPVGGRIYFKAWDPSYGIELWATDGTPEGTALVADLSPGALGFSSPRDLTAVGDTLYFTADLPATGRELWKLPLGGAPEIVVDLVPGEQGSYPYQLLAAGNKVAFSVVMPAVGRELGVSDGTPGGTEVFDVNPGTGSSYAKPLGANAALLVFFSASTPDYGNELYRLNLISGSVCRTMDGVAGSGSSNPRQAVQVGGSIYFTADTINGPRLWKATICSADQLADVDAKGLVRLGGADVLFSVAGDLWKTDGTPMGTEMIASPGVAGLTGSSSAVWFQPWDGEIWFVGDGGVWHTDGTTANTQLRFSCDECLAARYFSVGGDGLYLHYDDGFTGAEPWRITSSSFSRVADIARDIGNSRPIGFTEFGGRVYFAATTDDEGLEVLAWDGVAAAASVVEDLTPGSNGSNPQGFLATGSGLFYSSSEGGQALRVLEDPLEGSSAIVGSPTSASPLGALGDDMLFSGRDSNSVLQLWTTDGVSATQLSSFPDGGSNGIYNSGPAMVANGQLFFVAEDGTHGYELWASDGSTVDLVSDLLPGMSGSYPSQFATHEGLLYFMAYDGSNSLLWSTDGTVQNTQVVATNAIGYPFSFGSQLLYVGSDETTGIELWTTDGIPGHETILADLAPGPETGLFRFGEYWRAVVGDQFFFQAHNLETGVELWVSDGTAAGTRLVRDIAPGVTSSEPWFITPLPTGEVVFTAWTEQNGWELWRSNGTSTGTYRVSSIAPGPESSEPYYPTLYQNWVVFEASSGAAGLEPWAYDWTVAPLIFGDGFESGNLSAW